MRSKLRPQHAIAFVICCILVFCFGYLFNQNVEAQTSRPAPTRTRTPVRIVIRVTPIPTRIVAPGGTGGCGGCLPADIAALFETIEQKVEKGTFAIDENNWSAQITEMFPVNSPVEVHLFRTLDALDMIDEGAAGVVMSDDSGSLTVSGLIPEFSPGGVYVGVACTLDDCSTTNILANLDSPEIAVWQFELPSLIEVEAIEQPQGLQPALGLDYNPVAGLSDSAVTFQWSKDGVPILATNSLYDSLANPFVLQEDNRISLYEPRSFLIDKINAWFGTQYNAEPVAAGMYRVDVSVNGVYEKSVEIPVAVTP